MATAVGTRMQFENAKTLVRSLGYSVDHAKITQSYLRSEVALSTSSANYHIPVLVNDTQNGAVRVNERRLNLQDIFVASEWAVYFGIGTATDTKAKLYSYPNATDFTGTSDDDLWSLYNGYLNLAINNDLIVPYFDVFRSYFVPQTQESATLVDQLDASQNGFSPIEPGIVMNGAANINFQLTCGGAPATITTNSFICVVQRGILLQNVTTVK
tara:strand:- start:337 stop:975 length:639 start_codon:yes stop_codon:yes gene_type:complete